MRDFGDGHTGSGATISHTCQHVEEYTAPVIADDGDDIYNYQKKQFEIMAETAVKLTGETIGSANPKKNHENGLDGGYLTGFKNRQPPLIDSFDPARNFPNPFNPLTEITYRIAHECFVTLDIFDIQGRFVQTLVNKNQSTGRNRVEFDGGSPASGIYFYRLTAAHFRAVKKMTLLK